MAGLSIFRFICHSGTTYRKPHFSKPRLVNAIQYIHLLHGLSIGVTILLLLWLIILTTGFWLTKDARKP